MQTHICIHTNYHLQILSFLLQMFTFLECCLSDPLNKNGECVAFYMLLEGHSWPSDMLVRADGSWESTADKTVPSLSFTHQRSENKKEHHIGRDQRPTWSRSCFPQVRYLQEFYKLDTRRNSLLRLFLSKWKWVGKFFTLTLCLGASQRHLIRHRILDSVGLCTLVWSRKVILTFSTLLYNPFMTMVPCIVQL